MATREQLIKALKAADAAGNVDDARRLAAALMASQNTDTPTRRPETLKRDSNVPDIRVPKDDAPVFQAPEGAFKKSDRPAPSRKAPARPKTEQGLLGDVYAFGAGLGDMLFGVGTPVKAAEYWLGARAQGVKMPNGQSPTWGEAYEAAKRDNEALFQEHPGAYRIGEAAGIVPSFGAGGAVMKGVAKVAPQAAARVGGALTLTRGQPVRNAARMATGGALASGVTALNQTGDTDEVPLAATAGAVLGPVAGKVAGLVGKGADVVKRVPASFRLLAKRLGVSTDTVVQNFNAMKTATGRNPTTAALIDSVQHEKLASVWQRHPSAAETVQRGAAESAVRRQEGMATVIAGEKPIPAEADVRRAANDELTAAMQRPGAGGVPVEEARVRLSPDEVENILGDSADQFRALPRSLRQRVINDFTENGSDSLSVRSLEDLRRNAGLRAEGQGEAPENWRVYRDLVKDVASSNSDYAAAMAPYAGQMRRADMIKGLGPKAASQATDPIQYAGNVRGAYARARSPETVEGTRQGLSEGARSELTQLVGTPAGAVTAARNLSQSRNVAENLGMSAPERAQQLRNLGAAEYKAAVNEMGAVRAAGGGSTDNDTTTILQGVAAQLSPALSVPYKVWWAAKLMQFGIRKSTADDLASALMDPDRTPAVVEYLRRHGVHDYEVSRILQEFAATTGGIMAGTSASGAPTNYEGSAYDAEQEYPQ